MSIKQYFFTHYFDDIPYNFKVTDIGYRRLVECNGKEIYPSYFDTFEILDKNGYKHTIRFLWGPANRKCLIDNAQFDYLGLTRAYDGFFVFCPLVFGFIFGILNILSTFINLYILRNITNTCYRFVFCLSVTVICFCLSLLFNIVMLSAIGFSVLPL